MQVNASCVSLCSNEGKRYLFLLITFYTCPHDLLLWTAPLHVWGLSTQISGSRDDLAKERLSKELPTPPLFLLGLTSLPARDLRLSLWRSPISDSPLAFLLELIPLF